MIRTTTRSSIKVKPARFSMFATAAACKWRARASIRPYANPATALVAPGDARARHAGGKGTDRPGFLPAQPECAGLRVQPEDQPPAVDGSERRRSSSRHRSAENIQPGDRDERCACAALLA